MFFGKFFFFADRGLFAKSPAVNSSEKSNETMIGERMASERRKLIKDFVKQNIPILTNTQKL